MKEYFGKKIGIVISKHQKVVNLKYKVNWKNVMALVPFIFLGICLLINITLLIKKIVWVI